MDPTYPPKESKNSTAYPSLLGSNALDAEGAATRLDLLAALAASTTEFSPELFELIHEERLRRTEKLLSALMPASERVNHTLGHRPYSIEHYLLQPPPSALVASPQTWYPAMQSFPDTSIDMAHSQALQRPLSQTLAQHHRLLIEQSTVRQLQHQPQRYSADSQILAALAASRPQEPSFRKQVTALACGKRTKSELSMRCQENASFLLPVPPHRSSYQGVEATKPHSSIPTMIVTHKSSGSTVDSHRTGNYVPEERRQGKKRRQYEAETFPSRLLRMIKTAKDEGQQHLIAFTDDGTAVRHASSKELTTEVFPKYFRHQSFASFQRQLSMYGFARILKGKNKGAYAHPLFREDRPELIQQIKRASSSSEWTSQSAEWCGNNDHP